MKSLPPLQVILPSKSPTLPEELTPSICPTLLEILGIKLIMRDHDDLNIPIDHQPLTIDHRHGSEITTTHRPLCYPRVHRPFLLRQKLLIILCLITSLIAVYHPLTMSLFLAFLDLLNLKHLLKLKRLLSGKKLCTLKSKHWKKIILGLSLLFLLARNPLDANGYIKLSISLMGGLNVTKLTWSPKATHKLRGCTIMRSFHPLQNL